jgi:cytochrome c553
MSANKFAKEMRELKTETDKDGIMKPHATAYTDVQLREMGRYFASQARSGVAR